MVSVAPIEDYYAVLGIKHTDDFPAVEAAYQRLARVRHPDRAEDKVWATADYQLAYATLIDPERCIAYDKTYHAVRDRLPTNNRTTDLRIAAFRASLEGLKQRRDEHVARVKAEAEKITQLQTELTALRARALDLTLALTSTSASASTPEAVQAGWGSSITSLLGRRNDESESERRRKELEHMDCNASIGVKDSRVKERMDTIGTVQDELRTLEMYIVDTAAELQRMESERDQERKDREMVEISEREAADQRKVLQRAAQQQTAKRRAAEQQAVEQRAAEQRTAKQYVAGPQAGKEVPSGRLKTETRPSEESASQFPSMFAALGLGVGAAILHRYTQQTSSSPAPSKSNPGR